MRVLVCGGRDYNAHEAAIWLNRNVPIGVTCVIHGDARGADTGADQWAKLLGLPLEVYPADWKRDGMAAGPIRNAKMLKEGKPDLVIAFTGGNGTKDMVQRAKYAGVYVIFAP